MNLTPHNRNKILHTFKRWEVPKDFADPFYNYLVYGYRPGGCFEAVLANDFAKAISRSHPGNTIDAFKALVGWISDAVPEEARGSYEKVNAWCGIDPEQRRSILEQYGVIYSQEGEVWAILKNEPTYEPHLY